MQVSISLSPFYIIFISLSFPLPSNILQRSFSIVASIISKVEIFLSLSLPSFERERKAFVETIKKPSCPIHIPARKNLYLEWITRDYQAAN